MRYSLVKRRGIKDTKQNREILLDLGFTFICNESRGRIYIKVTDGDFVVIKGLISDGEVSK